MSLNKYRLGDLIELVLDSNQDLKYGPDDVRGMTINKEVIKTKADVSNTDLTKYLIVHPNEFIYNPRTHGKKIGFGFNDTKENFIISWNNIAFRVRDEKVVNPMYLFLHFNRSEWDREACFNSWGSSTEVFSWNALCDMNILLPELSIQQKYVNIYNAMVINQQIYEKTIQDLKLVCDGYIESLKCKYPCEKIGKFIKLREEKNNNLELTNVKGITVYKKFIDSNINMETIDFTKYKIVRKDDIAYVPTTNRNGDRLACAFAEEDCIISTIYNVIEVDKTKLNPRYLFLWFKRRELDRYARYNSWGSAREVIEYSDISDITIPIPPIEVQDGIANLSDIQKRKLDINDKLSDEIKKICPILINGSILEARKGDD